MKKRKRPKPKAPHGRTERASSRIFYRRPSEMFADFIWSGAGLTVIPLMFLGGTVFAFHVCFIKLCG